VSVAYESDPIRVREVLERAIERLDWRSMSKKPMVFLKEFGGSAVNYDVDVWLDDANDSRRRASDLHEIVWRTLNENNIAIAYPQLDLHLDQKGREAMAGKKSSP
jgi:small-conductance mechanosensitive channel